MAESVVRKAIQSPLTSSLNDVRVLLTKSYCSDTVTTDPIQTDSINFYPISAKIIYIISLLSRIKFILKNYLSRQGKILKWRSLYKCVI